MRRTPAATAPSVATLKRPISPVASRWVPPQSSVEKSPMRTTRTRSPYFSPNSAMAPDAIASSRSISSCVTGVFACTCSLTSSSICSTSRSFMDAAVREVEAQVIGRHQRARLRHVRAEHAAQRRVQEVRARVVLAQAEPPRRLHRHRHVLVLAEAARAHLHAVHDQLGAAVVGVDDLAAALPARSACRCRPPARPTRRRPACGRGSPRPPRPRPPRAPAGAPRTSARIRAGVVSVS